MQVTIKDKMIKKKTGFAWNLPLPLPSPPHPPEVECAMGVFQIQPPISGVNFLNNMLIPQARIVMSEIEHDTNLKLLNY